MTRGSLQTGSIVLPIGSTWYICSAQPTTTISYVTTYSNISLAATPNFGNVALVNKISPTMTATSIGLLSAAMTQTDLNKYLLGEANLFLPTYSCFDDRVTICARGSDLGQLPISAIYCVLVINPNTFTSYANVIVTFDNQPLSSSAAGTNPSPSITAQSTSSVAATTGPGITTVITVPVSGSMKVKWDFMSIFIFGLGSIIWCFGGLF
ncbi:5077_t:CDS:2 [Paraglomus occultum]|uniref:5077_t:CDS:1 n=1 Tax=Paraglomus occultum TaxID=144539 RepID=A0A9N9FYZ6_9GLOM|nr:5077_t:CDS:2 [Paraglomus occultum]